MVTRVYKIFTIFFVLTAIIFIVHETLAQNQVNYQGNLTVKITPKDPKPNELIEISLSSYEADLDRSYIVWTVNGKEERSGTGEKKLKYRMGDIGTSLQIDIQVTPPSGSTLHKAISISLVDIDLSWETNSYVPPLYPGHTRYVGGADVKVVATPHIKGEDGREIPSSELIYLWYQNNLRIGQYSGRGQNVAFFKSNLNGLDSITVNISTLDNKISVSKKINLEISEPVVNFYQIKNGRVDYANAIKNSLDLKDRSVSIQAIPYYFSLTNPTEDLNYYWKQNNEPLGNDSKQSSELSFSTPDSGRGTSEISLTIINKKLITQLAGNTITINFGQK
jgi:hypothetical protein